MKNAMTTQRPRWYRRIAAAALLFSSTLAVAAEPQFNWAQWRGPEQNGVSREVGLPDTWDPDKKQNLVWKNDVGGMSSPIVMNGKVFTQTRTGEVKAGGNLIAGHHTQESLIGIDAATGNKLWEYRKQPTQTEVPFHRLGWSGPAGDPANNRVYALFADCTLTCADANTGAVVWQRQMTEEFGMISTYGGRTPNPAIDEDMMFVGGVFFGWGDNARGQYRVFAFDKATGELRWTTPTGGAPVDAPYNTGGAPVDAPYNTPVFADIAGQRQVIIGAGDGGVHGFQSRTGKKLWSYPASKRGINASVLVDGNHVFIFHSEENLGEGRKMGAAICIDVSGEKPKEVWFKEAVEVGFSTPTMADGRIYVLDNSATLIALDAKTGEQLWKKKMGTIGKASLTYADGKLFVPEANGRFSIVKPQDKTAQILSKVELGEKFGREYAMYGSVAIAGGRIYLPTATAMYCIGLPDAKPSMPNPPELGRKEAIIDTAAKPSWIQVRPADVVLKPGQKVQFKAIGFDEKGREIGEVKGVKWSVSTLLAAPPPPNPPGKPEAVGNLKGTVDDAGNYTAADAIHQGGAVVATLGDVKGNSRVRVLPPLPWKFDFEDAAVDRPPLTWLGAGGKFHVKDDKGNKVLTKLTWFDLYYRANTFFGSVDMTNYTIQADVKAGVQVINDQKQVPDPAVMNNRYYLILYGNQQRLQLNVWATELPKSLNKTIDFKWDPEKWYTMKLRVEHKEGKAQIFGKVWEKGAAEPEKWTIDMVDSMPNKSGNPGVFGHSLVAAAKSEIYYDNVEVTENK
jgi:outer membrane protein assembly factor BamB